MSLLIALIKWVEKVLVVVLLSGFLHQCTKTMTTSIFCHTHGIRGFHYSKDNPQESDGVLLHH